MLKLYEGMISRKDLMKLKTYYYPIRFLSIIIQILN